MRSGSALSSGCLPALLRPEILLRPSSLLSFGSLLRPGSLLGSGILLCLRLQGISALRAKGLVIGYFSSTLRTKHKTPPHKQAPIRHYCLPFRTAQFPQSIRNFFCFSLRRTASSCEISRLRRLLLPGINSGPAFYTELCTRFNQLPTIHRSHVCHASPQPRLPQFTAATFAALPCAHIRLTSPRSHSPDSAQSPEPTFRSPDTALPPSSE